MKIEYHPLIAKELQEIIDYYKEISPTYSQRFLNSFQSAIHSIEEMPSR